VRYPKQTIEVRSPIDLPLKFDTQSLMNLRQFRYILIAFGEGLLIAILCLLFPKGQTSLLVLDATALSIAYLANVFGYPTLIKQEGADDAAGYGIAWLGTWLYTGFVLLAIILLYWLGAPLVWQIVVQATLLFLFLIAIYLAALVACHAGNIKKKK
jgi:uncharacterized membrane protein